MTNSVNSQNFNTATKQEISQAADQLLNSFRQSKIRLDPMSPDDQFLQLNTIQETYEGYALLENTLVLSGLQKRVSATYKQVWGAIPDISKDELKTISNTLKKSANLLNSISDNCALAKDICDLSEGSRRVFKKEDPSNIASNEVKLLQNRIAQLESVNTINDGNRTALEQLKAAIITATTPSGQVNLPITLTQSSRSNVFPAFVQPPASTVQPDKLKVEKEQLQEFPLDPQVQKILHQLKKINDSTEISIERKKEIFNAALTIVNASPLAAITLSPQTVIAEKKIDAIQELQGLLPLFQSASRQNLELGLANLDALKSKQINLPFKITNNTPVNVAIRPSFHLYFIHKKESPQNLKNDRNYGDKAMKGVYPASNTERLRAVMRTIAELALQKLEDAVSSNRVEDISVALSTLEELKMNTSDMHPGQTNLAYILFNRMYHKHIEARKNSSSLINPNDGRFQGEFGRNAFTTVEGINSADKIAVVNDLLLDLKNVWKIA